MRAKQLRIEGKLEAAENALAPYLLYNEPAVLQEYAHIAFSKHDWETSITRWHLALKQRESKTTFLYLIRSYRRAKKFAEAKPVIADALKAFPDDLNLQEEKTKNNLQDTGLHPYPAFEKEIATNYVSIRAEKDVWQKEHDVIEKILDQMDIGSVLDVPFGTGRLTPFYKEKELAVTGIDISQDMLDEARKILGDDCLSYDLRTGNVVELPFQEDHFDLSVCLRLISTNIPYGMAEPALKELHRVTSRYLITDIKSRLDSADKLPLPKPDEQMAARIRQSDIKKLLENIGWHIRESHLVYLHQTQQRHIYLLEKVRS